jgi:hypothetical protein
MLDEKDTERDEWMKTDNMSSEESSGLKQHVYSLKAENDYLSEEYEKLNDSYKIMEAEFSKFDEENNAHRNTIVILEKEVARRNEILEQYELGNEEIIDESQEKVKQLIDQNLESEQKLDDLQLQYIDVCDYLKDINNAVSGKSPEDEDNEKSSDLSTTQMTEEEIEELYEHILKIHEANKQDMASKIEELELNLEEVKIELSYRESELLDSQISGTQNSASQDDEERRKILRNFKERIDDLTIELKSKNNHIQQLNTDLETRISEVHQLETDKSELESKIDEYDEMDSIDELRNDNNKLQDERDDFHTRLMQAEATIENLQDQKEDELFDIKAMNGQNLQENTTLKARVAKLVKELEDKDSQVVDLRKKLESD